VDAALRTKCDFVIVKADCVAVMQSIEHNGIVNAARSITRRAVDGD
jgi:hypothetical protein